jgi:hypothetical protein
VDEMTFAPTVVAIGACERAGAAAPVELAFTCTADAEVIPARNREDPRT